MTGTKIFNNSIISHCVVIKILPDCVCLDSI